MAFTVTANLLYDPPTKRLELVLDLTSIQRGFRVTPAGLSQIEEMLKTQGAGLARKCNTVYTVFNVRENPMDVHSPIVTSVEFPVPIKRLFVTADLMFDFRGFTHHADQHNKHDKTNHTSRN